MESETYLAQLLTLPEVDHALLSPDGCWVAFNWYRIHENMDVFLVPVDGSASPVALTHTPEFTVLESWAPDSRAVVVSEDHCRDEHRRLFRVDIVDPNHPITLGMPPFETQDELYSCLTGDRPIHLLACAKSKVDGRDYPMAFVLDYGKGRVFHTVLGHDLVAITNPSVANLIRRGCAWAAGLDLPPN